jgi:hypothetical protein
VQLTSQDKRQIRSFSREYISYFRGAHVDSFGIDTDVVATTTLMWYLVWCDFAVKYGEVTTSQVLHAEHVKRIANLFGDPDKLDELVGAAKRGDELLVSATSFDELSRFIPDALEGVRFPYARRVREAMHVVSPAVVPRLLQHLRTVLLFASRITLSTIQPKPEEWWEHDAGLIKPDSSLLSDVLPRRHAISKKFRVRLTYDENLTSGSVSDVVKGRGSVARKGAASCSASREAWRCFSRYGLVWPNAKTIGTPSSKMLFVPKGIGKFRTICCEPAAQAWLQRTIDVELRRLVALTSRGRAHPEGADQNRATVAMAGYSTIDLSAASDSVHKDWIDILYRGDINRCLKAARTPLADGRELTKFAAMGGGNTFALQCDVFSAIVEQAYINVGLSAKTHFTIHGDDIIVKDEAYCETRRLLSLLGFKVNEEKSFSHPQIFRESCGHDHFRIDENHTVFVTPVRWSRHSNHIFDDRMCTAMCNALCGDKLRRDDRRRLRALITLANRLQMISCEIPRYLLVESLRINGANFFCEPDLFFLSDDTPSWLYSPTGDLGKGPFGTTPDGLPAEPRQTRFRHDSFLRESVYQWGLLRRRLSLTETTHQWLTDEFTIVKLT